MTPEGQNSGISRSLIAIFFAIVAVGMFGALVKTVNETFENRALAPWPKVKSENLTSHKTLKDLTAAIRDRHLFRETAIISRNWIKFKIFGDIPNKGLTYGQDDWIFMRGSAHANCHRKLSADVLARNVSRYLDSLPSQQRQLVVVFPDKEYLYLDKTKPESSWVEQQLVAARSAFTAATGSEAKARPTREQASMQPHACSNQRYDSDVEALSQLAGSKILDIRPDIQARKAASLEAAYFKQDTHWTFETSAWAGGLIVDRLQPGIWEQRSLHSRPGKIQIQDLSRIIGLPTMMQTVSLEVVRPGVQQTLADFNLKFSKRHPVRKFEYRSNSGGARLIPGQTVVIYDSFMIPNLSVISPYFEKITWIFWDDFMNPKVQEMLRTADTIVLASIYRLYPQRAEQLARETKSAGAHIR